MEALKDRSAKTTRQQSEEHHRQVLQCLPVAVYTCDAEGRILFYNKAAAQLWGRDPIIGKDLWCGSWKIYSLDGSPMEPNESPMALAVKEGIKTDNAEIIIERPDGTRRHVRVHPEPLFDDSGKVSEAFNMVIDVTEDRNASRMLLEREDQLRLVTEGGDQGTFTWDLIHQTFIFSDRLANIFGYPRASDLTHEKLINAIHPEDKIVRHKAIEESMITGVLMYEARIKRPDRSIRWIRVNGKIWYGEKRNPLKMHGMVMDITEQKRMILKVRESEERLRLAIESSGVGTWDLDIQSGMTIASEEHSQIFGYSNGVEWSTKRFIKHIFPDDLSVVKASYDHAIQSGKMFYEARIIRRDKALRWIRVNAKTFYDEKNRPVRMVGTIMDITDQQQKHEILEKTVADRNEQLYKKNIELLKTEEHYYRMIDEVQDYAIILLDKQGIIQNWNKGAEKIKGYKAEEIIGKHIRLFYQKEDQDKNLPEKLIEKAATTGRAVYEGWRLRKDGTPFWGSVVITAIHDDNYKVTGFSKVTRDLTERKRAEDELLRFAKALEEKNADLQRSNQELEQFAYIASHDLQEPLRKIQAFSSLLERNLHNPEEAKKYFEKINSSAVRMSVLIKDVLNYSRISRPSDLFEPVDLNQIIDNVKTDFELLIREKEAIIHVSQFPLIQGVTHQIHQLFFNLISNSLKFSKGKPVIEIDSEMLSQEEIEKNPKLNPYRKYTRITLKDNGIGFEQKYAEQIFTIFQRLNTRNSYSGTGIGLALCKKIVETHRGVITAYSEPGKGSIFKVILPLS